jgi:hypothetical protein
MYSGIIALRGAGSENDFPRMRPDQIRHLFPRRFDDSFELRTEFIAAGWIPQSVVKYGIMASSTSGSTRLVPLLSK